MLLVYWTLIFNIIAFTLYGLDKSFAKKGRRRISEKALIFWAVIGGSIGAFLGMQIFRHKTKKPKFKIVPVFLVIHLVLYGFCLYQNYYLTVSEYDVDLGLDEDITIVQISDLHNQFFGFDQKYLLDRIKAQDPDIIVITGDIVDMTHTNYSIAEDFVEGAVKIAPVYYVTGNHEEYLKGDKLNSFMDRMKELGVIFLDDDKRDMGEYVLAGIADRSLKYFDSYEYFDDTKPVILLAHEPQYWTVYLGHGADLVLTGHYHGGQIILPGVGGLVSPEFEFLPKLYEGMHDMDGMTLILSRGLGNSVLPVRINNYPEIVTVHVS